MDKEIKLKASKINSSGNSCNFCITPSGLTKNVNLIIGHHISIRMFDDCLKELVKQMGELKNDD